MLLLPEFFVLGCFKVVLFAIYIVVLFNVLQPDRVNLWQSEGVVSVHHGHSSPKRENADGKGGRGWEAVDAEKAQELVLEVGGGPILQSYASDGTPVQYKHKHVAHISQSYNKKRTYGGSAELLVQTCYYRAHNLVDGKSKDVVVVQDPLPLTN